MNHCIIALVLVASLPAADLIVHEPFATDGRLAGSSGSSSSSSSSTGFAGAWSDGHQRQIAEGLTSKLGQTPATSGGAASLCNPDWAAKRALAAPIGDHPGTWYVSLLARNDTGEQKENYFRAVLTGGGKEVAGLGKSWMGDCWQLLATGEHDSRASCTRPDAIFAVLKLTYDDKGAVRLWIDPELAAEPQVADVEALNLDLPPVDGVQLVAKKTWTVDELRIGTTWASVCPAGK